VVVCPGGASQSVVVHQLSQRKSQNPFRKNKGRVTCCAFHPTQPQLLVASETNVRVYNLLKQALTKTLLAGSGVIATMHIHPSGDHVLVGTEDRRCLWCVPGYAPSVADEPSQG
jgi:ribosome biogenesis protein ERB1